MQFIIELFRKLSPAEGIHRKNYQHYIYSSISDKNKSDFIIKTELLPFGFYLWNKDKKTSLKLTWFIIVILIIGIIFSLLINKNKGASIKKVPHENVNKQISSYNLGKDIYSDWNYYLSFP